MINIKDDPLKVSFGIRLRTLRIAANLSQERLANMANVPLSQIGRIERGTGNPTLWTMNALAGALNIQIHEFFS